MLPASAYSYGSKLSCRKYGLDENTIDFIGHALALHRDDRYLDEPALDTVKRMKVTIQLAHVSPSISLIYEEVSYRCLLISCVDSAIC